MSFGGLRQCERKRTPCPSRPPPPKLVHLGLLCTRHPYYELPPWNEQGSYKNHRKKHGEQGTSSLPTHTTVGLHEQGPPTRPLQGPDCTALFSICPPTQCTARCGTKLKMSTNYELAQDLIESCVHCPATCQLT